MEKLDFKKRDKAYYSGKQGRWDRLNVPLMTYLMIDGQGDPDTPDYARAISALYPLAYGVKGTYKAKNSDFVVPPLEAVWSADDFTAFVRNDRAAWRWTAMIRMPDDVNVQVFESVRAIALDKLARKPNAPTDAKTMLSVRLDSLEEGDSLQTLHIGPYSEETPVLADLHDTLMPKLGLTFGSAHHEIYLSDPRRVAPDRLRTILRQPVRPITGR
ncbi:MAG: GyrI-like domain-containing protein [Rhodobacteraceae bacterium]|nr:GyrI-like domain-containing protein [Paracoccaceae bacterium]